MTDLFRVVIYVMFDVEISLFIVTDGLLLEDIVIVVMSLLSFHIFTHTCHRCLRWRVH